MKSGEKWLTHNLLSHECLGDLYTMLLGKLMLNNQNSNHDCSKHTLTIVIENKIVALSILKWAFIHPSKWPCILDDDYDWEGLINKNEECLYKVVLELWLVGEMNLEDLKFLANVDCGML